ncbi:MAG TPA: TonB family protein [Steroidobacteraceae bacterium]|nr:TonB family protein [Steroidobacteraceae bacterium]
MDAADLIGLLTETALAASAGVLLALGVRRPLRQEFGPGVAYGVWLLVPAGIVAVLLPAATVPALPMAVATVEVSPLALASPAIDDGLRYATSLCALWLLGALVTTGLFAQQQSAFRAGLGRLGHRGDGMRQAESVAGLPAAIGLWRPMIVVPADFDTRYTPWQRRLMQAHERTHIQRGDLQLNALATALRCVFWFNPLMHLAARHFRHDQELACDQRVIARHHQARRDYGEAMLKTQLAAQPLPLGCHWAVFDKARSHPLKERIAMLKQPVPSLSRWIAGGAVLMTLLLSAGVAAWAAQPHRVAAATSAVAPPAPPVPPAPPAPPAPPSAKSLSPAIAPPVRPSPPAPPVSSAATANKMMAPPFPAGALANRISGKVVMAIDIDARGTPVAVEVEQSQPTGVFDQAAVDAVMKWTFTPEVKDGKQVASRIRVPIEFRAPSATQAAPQVSAELE